MTEHILAFLKALEIALPPFGGGHHGLSYCRYGSDDYGWADRLGLHLRLAPPSRSPVRRAVVRTLFLSDGDLERPAAELVQEVVALMNGCRD